MSQCCGFWWWWWLLLRLSKHQSTPTTVLLRTILQTWTITQTTTIWDWLKQMFRWQLNKYVTVHAKTCINTVWTWTCSFRMQCIRQEMKANTPSNAAAFFANAPSFFSNAVCSLQTQARTCHDHNFRQEQFFGIYRHYEIRKSVQLLITVVSLQTSKLWQTSVTLLGKLSAASPETNFRFFNSTVFTNPRITFALVLNNVTCDKMSPLSFAWKKFPW